MDDEQGHAHLDATIIRMLTAIATRDALPPDHGIPSRAGYLLFFDGGSRGNPGPGGSGAVIVQLGEDPDIVWAASMSYANDATTNNYAEYQGLCHGLETAYRYQWSPLEVIGDSNLIITQMRERRRPKAPRLRPLYEAARAAADDLRVRHWHHHYRSHNKMADKAANQAMDTRSSYQATITSGRRELVELRPWLNNDVQHWATATSTSTQRHTGPRRQTATPGDAGDRTGPGPPPGDRPPGG